jgi:predicted MFS family arabinose efflux permease
MTEPTREWRRGWGVLAASGLTLGCGANLHYYVSTFFVKGISEEFGITRGELASIQALALWGVLAAPFIGYLIDKVGANRVLTAGSLVLGLVYLAAANMPAALWAPLVVFLAIQSFGQATATVPHTRVISSWFERNRGMALGIAITGIPLMSAIVSPLLSALIAAEGWRSGYYLLGGLALVIALPLNAYLVRERPIAEEPGIRPVEQGKELREAVRSRPFWLLIGAMILINVPGGGFLNQLVPLLTDSGATAAQAALMVSIFAVAVIVGRLASGYLLDRMSPAVAAAAFTLAPAAGMIVLLLAPVDGVVTVGLGVLLVGIQQGAEIDLLAFFTARHFGLRRYSSIYSVGYAVSVIATSLGVVAFGVTHDWTGSYDAALVLSVFTFALGGACFLLLHWVRPFRAVLVDKPVHVAEQEQ